MVVDHLGKAVLQMRILLVEHLEDLLGVIVVLRKDDGLADLLAVIHRQAVGHQNMQYLADRISVEDPFIQRA